MAGLLQSTNLRKVTKNISAVLKVLQSSMASEVWHNQNFSKSCLLGYTEQMRVKVLMRKVSKNLLVILIELQRSYGETVPKVVFILQPKPCRWLKVTWLQVVSFCSHYNPQDTWHRAPGSPSLYSTRHPKAVAYMNL